MAILGILLCLPFAFPSCLPLRILCLCQSEIFDLMGVPFLIYLSCSFHPGTSFTSAEYCWILHLLDFKLLRK
jgi:hypothetical protein